ncbi:SDR family oxidoreductase [Vibrio pelagius]|uniref:SDR family oxidoreductase n=1 Tax=Vibrio pelagius TaxID=28169 RepID=UPI0021C3A8BA|nr:SDR family oxidoreductase [Vibrio pelagius]
MDNANKTVLVIGGSGGIGNAVVKQLQTIEPTANIHTTFCNGKLDSSIKNVTWHKVDITNELDVQQLASQFSSLDWVINCVGILHTATHKPEKSLNTIDPAFFLENMTTNALPTLLLAKHFTSLLKHSPAGKLATISAKVGSISDNRLGGWYSYRSSKAALNMLIKSISIEWSRVAKRATILSLHPGTTDTPLSKPFQTNVPEGKLFDADDVARLLLNIIERSTPQESGRFFAYNGEELPW